MYKELENKIGYVFEDKKILKQAFMHISLVNEEKNNVIGSNERLEFLGDAVVEIVVSELLYKKYPNMLEGDLSKLRASLVCEESFAIIAKELKLNNYIKMSKGEMLGKGYERDSILADAFEAVLGAMFLDCNGDLYIAKRVIVNLIEPKITKEKLTLENWDYKTRLQEIIQAESQIPVKYSILKADGPDHDKTFVAEVKHNNVFLGEGKGKTKKEAQQNAAKSAIKKLEQKYK